MFFTLLHEIALGLGMKLYVSSCFPLPRTPLFVPRNHDALPRSQGEWSSDLLKWFPNPWTRAERCSVFKQVPRSLGSLFRSLVGEVEDVHALGPWPGCPKDI